MEPEALLLCSQEPTASLCSEIHFNINLSMHESSEWSPPFRFSNQNCICISHLFHICYMFHPSHTLIWSW